MSNQHEREIEALRRAMGTMPETNPQRKDEVLYGLKHLRVELVDGPHNPYKAIYEMVTSTWGSRDNWMDRWENATPEGRMSVVEATLAGKTLPTALEAAGFCWMIQGCTRSAFDQLARHRASGISSVGSRDNNHADAAVVFSNKQKIHDAENRAWWKATKDIYCGRLDGDRMTWQDAREFLPMSMEWRFSWTMNFRGFQDVCKQRLVFCEQWDTVGVVWAMRQKLAQQYPLLAAYCRPRCDFGGKCTYNTTYALSEMFGALFSPCGRNPSEA
ncbi:MAG: FAD-dependent thymidylate synthase, partial [Actinomycetes bacterium]